MVVRQDPDCLQVAKAEPGDGFRRYGSAGRDLPDTHFGDRAAVSPVRQAEDGRKQQERTGKGDYLVQRGTCRYPDHSHPGHSSHPLAQLIPIPPGGELRTQRLPDSYKFQPLRVARDADVPGRRPRARGAEKPLTLLDRLPPLLERRQVPALALPAHDPEPSLRPVEGEAAPDGEVLDHLIRPEGPGARNAGLVHGLRLPVIIAPVHIGRGDETAASRQPPTSPT